MQQLRRRRPHGTSTSVGHGADDRGPALPMGARSCAFGVDGRRGVPWERCPQIALLLGPQAAVDGQSAEMKANTETNTKHLQNLARFRRGE